ncbi:hypothetical protein ACWDZ4_31330 [Streptomyces sp. NPDC003016]
MLFGDCLPTGKLPVTWMDSASQQPINDGDGRTPLFPYGYGLSYGTTPEPEPTPTPTPPAPKACSTQFRVAPSWSGGYQAEITVKNTGTASPTG